MNPNAAREGSAALNDQSVPAIDDDSTVQDSQVNPLTIMTSIPPFTPVDDDQENVLELNDEPISTPSELSADVSVPDISVSLTTMTNPTNNPSVAAWVESTAQETGLNAIERSPSLPLTLIESSTTQDRRNSTASTLCDQQLSSIISDTLSSQQISIGSDMQRSLSVPIHGSYHSEEEDPSEEDQVKVQRNSGEDDEPLQFLALPESEDSEVDKKVTKSSVVTEESVTFDSRSPTSRDSPKRSPNVSFGGSTSNATAVKPSLPDKQRRRNSWNTNKKKPPLLQRSQSYYNAAAPPLPSSPTSLHARILRKQFNATRSMTDGPRQYSGHPTHQSSNTSDQVFLSPSNSNSSQSRQFLAIPSSTSALSSERMTSLISDASGQSGIESTNLRTSVSDQTRTSSIDDQDYPARRNRFRESMRKTSYRSKEPSNTPSTESVSTSSDDDMPHFIRKSKRMGADRNRPEAAMDKRQHVVDQLKGLLEKKPTMYARFGLGGQRKHGLDPSSNTNKQHSHQRKSTPNSFVEFCSSFQSNNAQNAILRSETEVTVRPSTRLYSSVATNSDMRYSLPVQPILVNNEPLNESYSSIHSLHSDMSASNSLINSRPPTQADLPTAVSLISSLQSPRRRTSYRRNLTGLAAVTRDRKNSFTKSDPPIVSQSSQQDEEISPQTPNVISSVESILSDHLLKINKLLENPSWNATLPYTAAQQPLMQDGVYVRLNILSQQDLMHRRCSSLETKAFIDLITDFQMNRSHHYRHLSKTIQDSFIAINEPARASTTSYSENEEDTIKDGHLASNESSNTSSPVLTRLTSTDSNYATSTEDQLFLNNPLRCFRTLSEEYILDCERTELQLTKLFNQADQQQILYCLNHMNNGQSNDSLAKFHRQLEALFLWYNLYYELTLAVTKLSRLLRCHACADWPKLRIRTLATLRDLKAKQADKSYIESSSTDEPDDETSEESEVETASKSVDDDIGYDSDIIPRSRWTDEQMDYLSGLELSSESNPGEADARTRNLDRTECYRNFAYYMDKPTYQVKYDGLARTLIEPVASVLFKTRLALLHGSDRQKIRMEQIFAGVPCSNPRAPTDQQGGLSGGTQTDVSDDKLLNTNQSTLDMDTEDLTIEKWLFHILKSSSRMQTICSSADEILKENWFELHKELGLPPLLPFYFFIINVLLDVMNEGVTLTIEAHKENGHMEIDSLCRQQLVRDTKLVLRNSLVIRLYSFRMLEQFIPLRTIVEEFAKFDNLTLDLYTDYKQFLSTVCNNRIYGAYDDTDNLSNKNADSYYYVDEETSELIKEYYFARDLTLSLRNRTETHDLCIQFSTLIQHILVQLREALNARTENYYQMFALDAGDAVNVNDGTVSAQVISEPTKQPAFHASASVPANLCQSHDLHREDSISVSDRRRKEIIDRTRLFRASFDTIKQRATRVCSLAKTLIDDFSIAAEFKCTNYQEFWQQIQKYSYVQVKTYPSSKDTGNFDNFYVFVPPWLSTDPDQVDQLLSIVCSQQVSGDDLKKSNEHIKPSFMIFVPERSFQRLMKQWMGEIMFIQPNESTKLALNSTELSSLHLVVNRFDHWFEAVKLFHSHAGLKNIALRKKLARFEAIRLTFDQLPEHIDRLSTEITDLVRTLNSICDQGSIRLYLKELINPDQRAIESKLIDLVLYVYKSGFDLFRLLYDLIPAISSNHDELLKKSVKTMNEFFCEWCKCVAKKFKCASQLQTRAANYKVLRPRWLMPGMFFLRFLASSAHLQLMTDEDFERLITGMPAALDMRHGSMRSSQNSPTNKEFTFSNDRLYETFSIARSSSVSSVPGQGSRAGGHRRIASGGRMIEMILATPISVSDRIFRAFEALDHKLEAKLRDRKQIGQIYLTTANAITGGLDPNISLKARNIDFPWRRGTRIGQGGAGVAFRAINCSNGSIVCMKEILLSSISSRSLPKSYLSNLRLIAEEIDMIMTIAHPNIVRYFGIERYKRTIYICMEYCLSTVNEFLNDIRAFQTRADTKRKTSSVGDDSDDQDDELKTDQNSRWAAALHIKEHVRRFVKQLLHALMSLHELRIVHCDVKGDNIFISNENGHYIVKLGDFNLSHRFGLDSSSGDSNAARSTLTGTLYFKPPEPEYVFVSDIWALGCTIIEMLTGKLPWTHSGRPAGGDLAYIHGQLMAKKGPPIPEDVREEEDAYNFVLLCLQPEVEQRQSARELLNHPYPRVHTDS